MPEDPQTAGNPEGQEPKPDVLSSYVPDDLKEAGWLKDHLNKPVKEAVPTLLKNYGEAQKLVGRSIQLPQQEDDADGWSRVYEKLGRPESPDKYELTLPEIPQWEWQEDKLKEVKDKFHKAGMNSKQVQVVMDEFANDMKERITSHNQELTKQQVETTTKLKNEWSVNYDIKMAQAKRAAQQMGESIVDLIEEGHEDVIRSMQKLGEKMGEDTLTEQGAQHKLGMTPQEAQSEYRKLLEDNKELLMTGSSMNPKAQEIRKRMNQLAQVAWGG